MTFSHFSFPNLWTDCSNPTQCEKIAHLPYNAETANNMPSEWVEQFSDSWTISETDITVLDQAGLYHRTDGPAVQRADGMEEWWFHGTRHREDGPAIMHADGSVEWLVNGLRHRPAGPAVERADGTKEWWLDGVFKTRISLPPLTNQH